LYIILSPSFPDHPALLDLNNLIIFCEEYSLCCSLPYFLQISVTSSVFGPYSLVTSFRASSSYSLLFRIFISSRFLIKVRTFLSYMCIAYMYVYATFLAL
jgi:hypothetical protein